MTQDEQTCSTGRMPAVFVGVGSPRQMWDEQWATEPVPLVYDYYNFPPQFYEVKYSAPPAPELASRVTDLLGDKLDIEVTDRGLDHGAFVGLMGMYPEADVPVLEVSIPTFDPESLFAIGACLAPLRDEGVMVMGCGLLNHSAQSPEANREFDAWVMDMLEQRDIESLLRYQEIAPGVQEALPTPEHFVPLLVAYGAAYESGTEVLTGVGGFTHGGGSKRSIQFS